MPEIALEDELGVAVQTWLADFPPGAPVVVVPAYNAYEDVAECIGSLLGTMPPQTPLLLVDDASSDDRLERDLRPALTQRGGCYVRKPANQGFVHSCNFAIRWCAPRDVILVNSDVVVPKGWLPRLKAAAYSASTVATATPLTNYGSVVSVPYRNLATPSLPEGLNVDEVDDIIEGASLRLRPQLPTAVGHCMYIRRTVLDTIGSFDEALAPGYGEEVDFSQRALAAGFWHVAADDLFVFHKGSRSFSLRGAEERSELQRHHERIINSRYPWYATWVRHVEKDEESYLALAIERARGALLGYRIAIDGTKAVGPTTGTQVVTIELIRALVRNTGRCAHITLIVGNGVTEADLSGLDKQVDDVMSVSKLRGLASPSFDLVHCPYQISSWDQLNWLREAGKRLVVSQLDCIYYSNPSYGRTYEDWQEYRAVTQAVFAIADGVSFLSRSGADEAAQNELTVPPERACVTYTGVDHGEDGALSVPPERLKDLEGKPYILLLSTSFKHKNRRFALRLMSVLVAKYGWTGSIVVAGPRVAWGGSEAEEALFVAQHPQLETQARLVGGIAGESKEWLIRNAELVLYPSIREGFGIVPFEAAALGVPAISSRLASLPEVLGEDVAYFETLDPEAGADLVWSFLCDKAKAQAQVDAISARATIFTWDRVADKTWDFYKQLLAVPPRQAGLAPLLDQAGSRSKTVIIDEPVARNWPERVQRGFRIWRKHGTSAFLAESRQYFQWRRIHER